MSTRVLTAMFALAALAAAQADPAGKQPAAPKAQDPAHEKGDKQTKPSVLTVGTALPADLKLKDSEGKEFSFADQKGKIVFIHWWSTTCPWEKAAEPKINKLAADFKDKDVVTVAINSNAGEIGKEPEASAFDAKEKKDKPYAKLREKAESTGTNHRILIDHSGDVSRLFGAKNTPHCFVVDAKGVLAYAGALDGDGKSEQVPADKQYVRQAIEDLKANKPVTMSSSKPYG
jgi:thiol-disulfide isomerase/thioredoxin